MKKEFLDAMFVELAELEAKLHARNEEWMCAAAEVVINAARVEAAANLLALANDLDGFIATGNYVAMNRALTHADQTVSPRLQEAAR